MANVLQPKVEASGLMDVMALGIAKSSTERLLTPIVGNASIKSGAVKLIGGGLIGSKGGKIGKAVSGGLIVDGIEDIVASILDPMVGAGRPDSGAW